MIATGNQLRRFLETAEDGEGGATGGTGGNDGGAECAVEGDMYTIAGV
jgi:hypothetical protein